ncbi:MAG: glycosyltransferase family 8 protein [Alphaproteobacteria bacterium]|nr:glycosyltransferase family 8 protein [Alphaproteobacteria bacterium]
MDIFLCINEKYVKFALITIVSVMENHRRGRVAFHVIGADITAESKRKFAKLKKAYKNLAIDFAVPDLKNFAGFKNDDPNLGLETYIRFLIPDLYPKIDKGLYIDVDLIATKNLAPLWNTNITRHLGAGVRAPRIDANIAHKANLGIAPKSLYINAGVMLMNLKKIRAEGVKEKLFDAALRYKKVIKNPSQDPTNVVFEGRLVELAGKYNFTNVHRQKASRREINDAAVYHYTGAKKPWNHSFAWLHKLNIPGIRKPEYYLWHKYNRINERIQAE